MKRGLFLVAMALVAISAACGPGAARPVGSDAKATRGPTMSPVKDPKLVVGEKATTTKDGNTLIVLSYGSPVSLGDEEPERDSEFSVIKAEACASGSSGEDAMYVGSNAFTLRLPGGESVQPEGFLADAKVEQPNLQTMDPLPGECATGFVTFQTPRDERPELVVFKERFVLQPAIAWKVPSRR